MGGQNQSGRRFFEEESGDETNASRAGLSDVLGLAEPALVPWLVPLFGPELLQVTGRTQPLARTWGCVIGFGNRIYLQPAKLKATGFSPPPKLNVR